MKNRTNLVLQPSVHLPDTVWTLNHSDSLLQSPAESPVHLSRAMKANAMAQDVSDDGLSKSERLESLRTSNCCESCGPATKGILYLPMSDTLFSDYACAICLDILEDETQVRGLPCGHAFHVTCVDKWLLWRQPCCPVCKAYYKRGPDKV